MRISDWSSDVCSSDLSTSWRPMLPCCAIIVEPSRRATSAEPSPVEGVDGGRPRSEQDFTAKDPVMTKVTNRRNRRRRAIYRHPDVGDGCPPQTRRTHV